MKNLIFIFLLFISSPLLAFEPSFVFSGVPASTLECSQLCASSTADFCEDWVTAGNTWTVDNEAGTVSMDATPDANFTCSDICSQVLQIGPITGTGDAYLERDSGATQNTGHEAFAMIFTQELLEDTNSELIWMRGETANNTSRSIGLVLLKTGTQLQVYASYRSGAAFVAGTAVNIAVNTQFVVVADWNISGGDLSITINGTSSVNLVDGTLDRTTRYEMFGNSSWSDGSGDSVTFQVSPIEFDTETAQTACP